MVQEVTLPLSVLNTIPGVSGVQDVEFSIPELEDIIDAVVQNTLDRTDVDEIVTEALAGFVDEVVDEIEASLPEVEFPAVEVFAQEFIEALTDLDGFFGPVEGDFRRALQDVLGDPELPLEGFDIDLSGLQESIDEALSRLDELEVPTTDEITEAVTEEIEDLLEDVLPTDFLDDPVQWIEDNLLDVTPDIDPTLETRLEELESEEGP